MPSPIGTLEFFALEAGEYLERLATLVAKPGGPAADELVRYARALRGSALMASQQPMSKAAAGLEALGRALREGRRQWDPRCTEVAGQAVEELKGLLRQVTQWTPEDDIRAARVTEDLQALAGPPPEPVDQRRTGDRRAPAGPDAGVRAFVAREAALIAGALDRAVRALEATPSDHAPLHMVLRRMQSLRGLATLSDLTPLPELLDGVERAIADLSRLSAPPPAAPLVFAAAARALTRVSTEVAGAGRPDITAPETAEFAVRLISVFAVEPDVVPAESLAPEDTDAILRRGAAPEAPAPTALELVGQGEYLVQVADDLERATYPALRALRLHALVSALHGAARPASGGVGRAMAGVLEAARRAAVRPDFPAEPELLAGLRRIGAVLRSLKPDADLGELGRALGGEREPEPVSAPAAHAPADSVTPPAPAPTAPFTGTPTHAGVAELRRPPAVETVAAPVPTRPPPAPIAALVTVEEDAVPIEHLLEETNDLAGSLLTLLRLRGGNGQDVSPVIDVRELVYSGRRALDRAIELRQAVAARLAAGEPPEQWRPALDELLDLLPLAAEEAR